jgi:hypothetical protein
MTELRAIGRQIIKAGENQETQQTGIRGWNQNICGMNVSFHSNLSWKVTHQIALLIWRRNEGEHCGQTLSMATLSPALMARVHEAFADVLNLDHT